MNELLVLGLDTAGVKECWRQTPELMKLQPGMLLDKVALLQAMFPNIDILEVLRTAPSSLLHPTRNLRERVQFLRKLGGSDVTLADARHSFPDPAFAVLAVGEHLASSGKTLLQLCSELQVEPDVKEYMEANQVVPATMDEYKYFLVVMHMSRPQRITLQRNVVPAVESV